MSSYLQIATQLAAARQEADEYKLLFQAAAKMNDETNAKLVRAVGELAKARATTAHVIKREPTVQDAIASVLKTAGHRRNLLTGSPLVDAMSATSKARRKQ